jgi:hypothetical protein
MKTDFREETSVSKLVKENKLSFESVSRLIKAPIAVLKEIKELARQQKMERETKAIVLKNIKPAQEEFAIDIEDEELRAISELADEMEIIEE